MELNGEDPTSMLQLFFDQLDPEMEEFVQPDEEEVGGSWSFLSPSTIGEINLTQMPVNDALLKNACQEIKA
eukprot:8360594-Ditylum_brightwellii.AAC.1